MLDGMEEEEDATSAILLAAAFLGDSLVYAFLGFKFVAAAWV
jgi:hypothetical protein